MHQLDTALSHTPARRGFNLVEAAIVLGVVGLVIGGIWVTASAVSRTIGINKIVTDVLLLQNNLRNLFGNVPEGTYGLDNQELNKVLLPGVPTCYEWRDHQVGLNMCLSWSDEGDAEDLLILRMDPLGTPDLSICTALGPRLAVALNQENVLVQSDAGDISTPALAAANCSHPSGSISILMRNR